MTMTDERDLFARLEREGGHGPPADWVNPQVVAAISREIARIHSRFFGRGPTKAKTIYRGDLILTVLEKVFTKGELLLVDGGRFGAVRDTRLAFHDEMEPLYRGVVHGMTDRPVTSCLG